MNHVPQIPQPSSWTVLRLGLSLIMVSLVLAGPTMCGRHANDGFAAPTYWWLAMLLFSVAIPLRASSAVTLQRILATYFVAVSVDRVSGIYVPMADNLHVAVGLIVAAVVVVAAWVAPARPSRDDVLRELPLVLGWTMVVIGVLLLATGLLVHGWYGSSGERSFGVLGQLAIVLLATTAVWRLVASAALRITIGIVGAVTYSWMVFS